MANVDTIDITKLIFVEQGSTPSTPAATKQKLFIRSSDHLLCTVDSSGTVTPWGGALTNPMTTQDDIIIGGSAGAPARLAAGSAGARLAMGNGAIIWDAGTSFPVSKSTNDVYHRTDIMGGLDFFWDGTRWRSVQVFEGRGLLVSTAIGSFTITTTPMERLVFFQPTYDIWLLELRARTVVLTTSSGTQFWTIALKKESDNSTVASFTTASDTHDVWTNHLVSIAASSTEGQLYWDITKTSTPGAIVPLVTVTYQLIAT